jgi:hypothetical protein
MKNIVTQDEQPVIRHVGDYFASIGPIWDAYYAGRISAVTREALLSAPRRILKSLPVSDRFRG